FKNVDRFLAKWLTGGTSMVPPVKTARYDSLRMITKIKSNEASLLKLIYLIHFNLFKDLP
ncbi:17811_t:CDS:1, partial [Dentiscutata erythropus]